MVDHFAKFGWAILMENKKQKRSWVLLKQWLTSYLKPKNLLLVNGWKFRNKVMENYLT